jgi:hypothetical protein
MRHSRHPFAVIRLILRLALLSGCGGPDHPPPPPLSFAGLPVSGSLEDALKAGFTSCWADTNEMRCRRDAVTFLGFGPLNAALDLNGNNGGGGFDQLTLWHDSDQSAAIPIGVALQEQGWESCLTGDGRWGDQAIYTRPGSPVRISMDISYWGKRRIRVIPEWNNKERRC